MSRSDRVGDADSARRLRFSFATWLGATGFDLCYLVLLVLLFPWLLFLIVVRRRGVGSLAERLGFVSLAPKNGTRIWIHAVSVGELEAALPLINALQQARPDAEIVVSSTTTSARQLASHRLPNIQQFYYPLDFGPCVRRTLKRVQPDLIVLMELEVWPNLTWHTRAVGIPVAVVNGRVSARGYRRMTKAGGLLRPVLRRVDRYLVQNEEYRERLAALGVPGQHIEVTGNLKLDRAPVEDRASVRARFEQDWGYKTGQARWVAGCTHPGEEQQLLTIHERLARRIEGLTLILAPRHVERSEEVMQLVRDRGLTVGSYEHGTDASAPDVVVLDVTGKLGQLYAAADGAFVGGSLVPRGGHNVLEPALAATPVLYGPHTDNFKEIVLILVSGGADGEVADGDQLGARIGDWLADPAAARQHAEVALVAIEKHRGAAGRTVRELVALLGVEGATDSGASEAGASLREADSHR